MILTSQSKSSMDLVMEEMHNRCAPLCPKRSQMALSVPALQELLLNI